MASTNECRICGKLVPDGYDFCKGDFELVKKKVDEFVVQERKARGLR